MHLVDLCLLWPWPVPSANTPPPKKRGQLPFISAAFPHLTTITSPARLEHFELHLINMKDNKNMLTHNRKEEGRFWTPIFCHADTVCRSTRAQRRELRLRNTDRLSQLLLFHPPSPPPRSMYWFYPFHLFCSIPLSALTPQPL